MKIGLWPVKGDHISKHATAEDLREINDLNELGEAKEKTATEFWKKEFKWRDEPINGTKWSCEQNILWVKLKHEGVVNCLYRILATLQRDGVKLLQYTPNWAYN